MELIITMPRGDIRNVKFCVRSGDQMRTDFTEIFFTVKNTARAVNFIFQKKLTDGDITLGEDNYYHMVIASADTDAMDYGSYRFDIEVVGEGIKQTTVGTLKLTDEVTFATNE